jgi:bifunctional DNA-binding transcriptional regulator/antitoxin component of YhaV-PrlF toxin-antitoxin module
MEVKVKIDKFGRILIPKKVREAKGYICGTELSLVMEPETEAITLQPKEKKREPYVIMAEWGLPLIVYPDGPSEQTMSTVEMIAEDREERSRITSSGYLKFNPKSAEEE